MSYREQYTILESFHKNTLQNMQMAYPKENPTQIVVINTLNQSALFTPAEWQQPLEGLSSLRAVECEEDQWTLITEYHEGQPLDKFINHYNPTLELRLKLGHQLFECLKRYVDLPMVFLDRLLDIQHLVVKDESLFHNELLLFESDAKRPSSFGICSEKLAKILSILIPDVSDRHAQAFYTLIDDLLQDSHYQQLSEVITAFEALTYRYQVTATPQETPISDLDVFSVFPAAITAGLAARAQHTASEPSSVHTITPINSTLDDMSIMSDRSGMPEVNVDDTPTPLPETEAMPSDLQKSIEIQEALDPEPILSELTPGTESGPKPIPEHILEPVLEPVLEPEFEIAPVKVSALDTDTDTFPILDTDTGTITIFDTDTITVTEQQTAPIQKDTFSYDDIHIQIDDRLTLESRKKRRLFLILAPILLILLSLVGLAMLQGKGADRFEKPVAQFTQSRTADVWQFNNISTADVHLKLTAFEWVIQKDGAVIAGPFAERDIQYTFENEGSYHIILKVMDSERRWSEPFTLTLAIDDNVNAIPTDPLTTGVPQINAPTTLSDSVKMDQSQGRSDTESYQVILPEDNSAVQLTFTNVPFEGKGTLSFWMKISESGQTIVTASGLKNGTETFTTRIDITDYPVDSWFIVTRTIETTQMDSLSLAFSGTVKALNFDDLNLEAIK